MNPLKRTLDLIFAITVGAFVVVPMLLIALIIMIDSRGPILYWSNRIGYQNRIFRMPKFRSMRMGAPALATHLLSDPDQYLTSIGSFLRKTSLDELPQIWSILKGEMSLVGPRPALFNQQDLIALRDRYGWAQVNGRDELSISEKVKFDVEYLRRQSFLFDLKILWLTFLKVVSRDGISH